MVQQNLSKSHYKTQELDLILQLNEVNEGGIVGFNEDNLADALQKAHSKKDYKVVDTNANLPYVGRSIMPYKSLSELPKGVKNNLPQHAQEIYLAAFNHAWCEYADPKKRNDASSQEAVAHKVAWAAVEKKYAKKEGQWQRKDK